MLSSDCHNDAVSSTSRGEKKENGAPDCPARSLRPPGARQVPLPKTAANPAYWGNDKGRLRRPLATTAYAYDDNGWLTDLVHDKDTTSLASYDWTYDAAGRITQFVSVDGTTDYTYDDTGQLTEADHDYQTDETYSYDATGNRTNTGYTTGDNNQLLDDGTYDYQYDDEGNRTKKTHSTTGDYVEYEWDHRNRLILVTFRDNLDAKTKEVRYTYDVYNRLIRKEVDDNGNGTFDRDEAYLYDGDDVILIFDNAGDWTHRYLHGDAVDQVFMEETVGEILWGLADNQGTIRDIANYDPTLDATTVVNHREFDSFGNITAESNSSQTYRYAYTGRFYDADSELQYNRARWYDPAVGRWVSEDLIGFDAGDYNVSRYVGNGPTNSVDPSGLIRHDPYADTPFGSSEAYQRAGLAQGWLGYSGGGGSSSSILGRISDAVFGNGSQHDVSFWGYDEDAVFGQLAAGDIHGNQIWGDPGIAIDVMIGPVHVPWTGTEVTGEVGFGFEFIYDWGNDGQPGTGWNLFFYPQVGGSTSPGTSASASVVNVYNFGSSGSCVRRRAMRRNSVFPNEVSESPVHPRRRVGLTLAGPMRRRG